MAAQNSHASLRQLRRRVFSGDWSLDSAIAGIGREFPLHSFPGNPSGQFPFVYLTRYVKAVAEMHFSASFDALSVLDWGCGKGYVSKMIRDLNPGRLTSCDIVSAHGDSAFGQDTPVLQRFVSPVTPLTHESKLPFADGSFDIVLSFGVLEHVANDRASLSEITRVLRPRGLLFCFHLPAKSSWPQFMARRRGDNYHDRLYTPSLARQLLSEHQLTMVDLWYRGLLPKNRIRYPDFRLFERVDQLATEYTPLRYLATNIEFVCSKAISA